MTYIAVSTMSYVYCVPSETNKFISITHTKHIEASDISAYFVCLVCDQQLNTSRISQDVPSA